MLSQNEAVPDTFSVTDLSSAFGQQLFLDEESSQLLTINTRKGLFRSKRLCFGKKNCNFPISTRYGFYPVRSFKGVMVRVHDILVATSVGVTTHMEVIKQGFWKTGKAQC